MELTKFYGNSDAEFLLAMKTRHEVFVEEQKVPAELELDEYDAVSWHILVTTDNNPVATGRIYKDPSAPDTARMGRIAVIKSFRNQGYGKMVTDELIKIARSIPEITKILIHSQSSAISFYKMMGFETISEPFTDAGIVHVEMALYQL